MSTAPSPAPARVVNGLDLARLARLVDDVAQDPARGRADFEVTTRWRGGTRSESHVAGWALGGRRLPKDFTLRTDEPVELLGDDTAPNPQEMLLAAYDACVMVGWVAACAVEGIRLEALEIATAGTLDLRGFLGLDPAVKPGYDSLRTTIRVKADASPEKLREIDAAVRRTSPNLFNLAHPVRIDVHLLVG